MRELILPSRLTGTQTQLRFCVATPAVSLLSFCLSPRYPERFIPEGKSILYSYETEQGTGPRITYGFMKYIHNSNYKYFPATVEEYYLFIFFNTLLFVRKLIAKVIFDSGYAVTTGLAHSCSRLKSPLPLCCASCAWGTVKPILGNMIAMRVELTAGKHLLWDCGSRTTVCCSHMLLWVTSSKSV